MVKPLKYISVFTFLILCCLAFNPLKAQDLDPRAYVWVPVKGNFLSSGLAFSEGGVLIDPSLPIENLKANVQTVNIGYARSFNLLGKTASAFVALPYSWAQASALVNGQSESISRSGFSDMRMRLSVLVLGAPATTAANFGKLKQKTILGVSVTMSAPTGQYFPDKLINLGTNRWAFKPELALSHPMGKRWLIDLYTGLWMFTNNNQFFTGKSIRTQQPLGSFQAHLSYTIRPKMWLALDATYYTGGNSSIDGVIKDDRQNNSRIGATFVFPVLKHSSIKLAASTGAIVRVGADFNTYSIGWQTTWLEKPKSRK
jgi:Putative MetA-pathway of phenol degradation